MAAMVVKMLMKTMANDDDQGCRDWRSPYGDNVYQEGLKFDDQLLTTFIGGIVIGFIRGWMLALVVLACIPLNILSFATVSRLRAQISFLHRGCLD